MGHVMFPVTLPVSNSERALSAVRSLSVFLSPSIQAVAYINR
jgi:hypothetical protein